MRSSVSTFGQIFVCKCPQLPATLQTLQGEHWTWSQKAGVFMAALSPTGGEMCHLCLSLLFNKSIRLQIDLYLFTYSSQLVELLIVEHANSLCVSTTQFSTSLQGPVPKRKLIFKLHSQIQGTHTNSHTERVQMMSCSYLNAAIGTLKLFVVVKL